MSEITVTTDLTEARARAERAADLLRALRARHDLSRYEFARTVRIAPLEVSPDDRTLTLGTSFNGDRDGFLSMYLNRQIRWYLAMHRASEMPAVLVVSPMIRAWLSKLLRRVTKDLTVLSYVEIPDDQPISVTSTLSIKREEAANAEQQ